LPGRTEENHEIPVRMISVLAKISTEHLPNANLKHLNEGHLTIEIFKAVKIFNVFWVATSVEPAVSIFM
jgi:hypothetical protein